MDKTNILKNWNVIILQSSNRAVLLHDYILSQSGQAIFLPPIKTLPLAVSQQQINDWQTKIMDTKFLIVSSQNAIIHAPSSLLDIIKISKTKIITMGKTTSRAAAERGLTVFFTAPPGSTSESLLLYPFLQENNVKNQNIALLAGEGGRQEIADQLTKRRAKIIWMKVYQQQKLSLNLSPLQYMQHKQCCLIAMSLNGLNHFFSSLPRDLMEWAYSLPLIVVSERIAKDARRSGARCVFISPNVHIEGIVTTLKQLTKYIT